MSDTGGDSFGAEGAGFGAGASLVGAFAKNESIRQAGSADVEATQDEFTQIDQSTALEVQKRANESSAVRARLRVLAGDSGLSFQGGSFQALQEQSLRDEQINQQIVRVNAYNQKRSINSQLKANLIRLFNGTQSPAFAGLEGGMAGYKAGKQIGGYLGDGSGEEGTDLA